MNFDLCFKGSFTLCDLYDTILLYYYTERGNLQISEYERSCVQLIALHRINRPSCVQSLVGNTSTVGENLCKIVYPKWSLLKFPFENEVLGAKLTIMLKMADQGGGVTFVQFLP